MEEYILAVLAVLLTIWLFQKWKRNQRLPPGPRGIPFIGNLFQFDIKNPLPGISKWRKEFGDIFRIKMMGQDLIVVSSLDLIKDVLVNKHEHFSGRPNMVKVKSYFKFNDVITATSSPAWKIKKKVMFTSLKMYGEELKKLEMVTLKCIQDQIKAIQDTGGKPFNPRDYIHTVILEILCILVYGQKLPEKQLKKLIDIQELAEVRHFDNSGPGVELEFFPWLRHLGHPIWKEIEQNSSAMLGTYSDLIEERRKVWRTDEPECVIDGLLHHQAKKTKESAVLTDEVLSVMVADVFEAGVSTTKRTMLAFIAVVVNFPEVQKKIQEEIDTVIGNDVPRLQDKQDMHYTSACLLELTRYASVLPILVPHMATEDHKLGSYMISKGSQIWCNNFHLSHDPRVWDDPWSFKPERFLDEQGHLVASDHPNRRNILVFGAGQRICVGEVLAKNRMFLIVVCLLQKFKFFPAKGKFAPNHDPRSYGFSVVMLLKEYEIMAKERTKGEYN